MYRQANLGDLDALLPLAAAYYAEAGYPWDEGEMRAVWGRLLAAEPPLGEVWMAEVGGAAVAYAVLCLGYSLEHRGRDAFVDELYVRPGHRGQGLGKAGLAALRTACARLGVRRLHLEVERENREAQRLYLQAGFIAGDRVLMSLKVG